MVKITYKEILVLVALFGMAILASVLVNKPWQVEASVDVSHEYNATTTDAGWNAGQCQAPLASTTKVLGSVIVTLTSNAPLEIYDATTTSSHSDHATTSIALFKTTTADTYTFDVRAKRGICVVNPSTVGVASTTITTRNY